MKDFLLVLLISLVFKTQGNTQDVSPSEYIINSTIKIESIERKIEEDTVKFYRSSGTGFFFVFKMPLGEIPVIVTNKHVIENSEDGILYFKLKDTSSKFDYNYKLEKLDIPLFNKKWILHPDTAIDLAIMPLAPFLNYFDKEGKMIIYAPYSEEYIPNDSIQNTLMAVEDVLMIGYPFGLRDLSNDLPIVRKGITATPPFLNYNSKAEFLCDIPIFPGSSGCLSPLKDWTKIKN